MKRERGILAARVEELRALLAEVIDFTAKAFSDAARAIGRNKSDFATALCVGVIAAAFAAWRFYALDFSILSTVLDFWFEADAQRIIEADLSRWSEMHYRTSVHPLFSLLTSLPVMALVKFGLSPQDAIGLIVSASAFLFMTVFYAVARGLDLRKLDSVLLCALMLATSACMFWLPIPETYALGGASILIPFFWLLSQRGRHDALTGPLQAIISLSITVTNGMAGLWAAFLALGARRAILVGVVAFASVAALSVVQHAIFPAAGHLFSFADEARYISPAIAERLAGLAQPILAPQAVVVSHNHFIGLSFAPFTLDPLFIAAAAGWLTIVVLAVEAIFRGALKPVAREFLLLIPVQLVLHAVYGKGYFLYALHIAPLFVLALAASLLGPRRLLAVGVIAFTILCSGAYNFQRLDEATQLHNDYPRLLRHELALRHSRGEALEAIYARPDDPWPRNEGHFLWGAPGAPLAQKGYFEPAGSLTPRVGGPGISIWVYDAQNTLLGSSDTVSAADAWQSFVVDGAGVTPAVLFRTPLYQAKWRQLEPNRWSLEATPQGAAALLALTVRGVGPASGRVLSIAMEGATTALVDDCWRISVSDGALGYLGEDGGEGWRQINTAIATQTFESPSGWASMRINGPRHGALRVGIENICESGVRPRWSLVGGASVSPAQSSLAGMMAGQLSHLLMSLEGEETRPGDPVSYPMQWQRDGGYVVVAMVRAGRLDVARNLVWNFAEHDFFGGFGAEADAPGIALWAIGEVSRVARDQEFDRALWPHVQRKANFILELMAAREDVRRPFVGGLAAVRPDTDLVARASMDGLIRGRMDWHEPLLFVNGFSWRGLIEAAEIADRVGAQRDAARWRGAAADLLQAWRRRFIREGLSNERTAASALWPTWAAGQDRTRLARLLRDGTSPSADAQTPWSYFAVARAHQFMLLGDVEGAWERIDAVLARSPAPNLGVLWESDPRNPLTLADDNWDSYRVGAGASPLTPHYWSAAELLLFALESLVYVDETQPSTIVIGGGVRSAWLDQPFAAQEVYTPLGRVDWRWDGREVRVKLENLEAPIRLGPAFPADTPVVRTAGDWRHTAN